MWKAKGSYLFTSESVSDGHPDKVCDAISDGILDMYLSGDGKSRVAVETMVTKDRVMVVGEVTSGTVASRDDIESKVRDVVREIGYESDGFDWRTLEVGVEIQAQSGDIAQGVDVGGAGDQGIMFGFACDETEVLMPAPIYYCHRAMENLRDFRKSERGSGFGPDAKVQLTLRYENGEPCGVHTAVMSSLHEESLSESRVGEMLREILRESVPEGWLGSDTTLHFNPTGRFVSGGPACDAGLTGRKIVVDTYGGAAPHGGGAFSGKDSSKVDRSAAYAARYVAKNVVEAGLARRCLIQVAYAIGKAEPLALYVDCAGSERVDKEVLQKSIGEVIDWRPLGIRARLGLDRAFYGRTSSFGHFGREVGSDGSFSWELCDLEESLCRLCGVEKRLSAAGC
jgi:S-adenosylmethionine synthetase